MQQSQLKYDNTEHRMLKLQIKIYIYMMEFHTN